MIPGSLRSLSSCSSLSLKSLQSRLRRVTHQQHPFVVELSDRCPGIELDANKSPTQQPLHVTVSRWLLRSTNSETLARLHRLFLLLEKQITGRQNDFWLEGEIAALQTALRKDAEEQRPRRRKARSSDLVLFERWVRLRREYFPDAPQIEQYIVNWSPRKVKRCLASCNVYRFRVSVAKPMLLPESAPYLDALLYHEMCHAYLGVPKTSGGRRSFHGPEFKALERRHPGIPALDAWIRDGGWMKAVRRFRKVESSIASTEPGEKYLSVCESIFLR